MVQPPDRIQRILLAGRLQFSKYGFSGARIDTISADSKTNKRLVYEFCNKKEGLYLAVLSDVSREVMTVFENIQSRLRDCQSVHDVYMTVVDAISPYREFIRLWAWEQLSPTIHGPRIIETMDAIFSQLRNYTNDVLKKINRNPMNDIDYASIETICRGYLLARTLSEPDEDTDACENLSTNSTNSGDQRELVDSLYNMMQRGIDRIVDNAKPQTTHRSQEKV